MAFLEKTMATTWDQTEPTQAVLQIRNTIPKRESTLPIVQNVLLEIFGLLDVSILGRCAQVCTAFYHLLEDKFVWRKSYCITWPSSVLESMDGTIDWKVKAFERSVFEKSLKDQQHIVNMYIKELQTNGLDSLPISSLSHMQNALRDIKDCKRTKQEFQKENIPQWMTEGTYFDYSSYSIYTEEVPIQRCKITWYLFGRNGTFVRLTLEASPTSNLFLLSFEDHQFRPLVEYGARNPSRQLPENFQILTQLLAVEDLTHEELFRYVCVCCHFREVTWNDVVKPNVYLPFLTNCWPQKQTASFYIPPPTDSITLLVVSTNGPELYFKIRKTTQLRKLMLSYVTRLELEYNNVQFKYRGQLLHADQTPADVNMTDGDTIDAFKVQRH